MPDFDLHIDGRPARVGVDAEELDTVHLPLLRGWARHWQKRRGRWIVFLAGPPGAGKTYVAGLWEHLAQQGRIAVPVQSLPMDGFHYPNRVLDATPAILDGVEMLLRRIKGRPETFDVASLRRSLVEMRSGKAVRWPHYDRVAHDPIPDAIPVLDAGILVVEGMYLLVDVPPWDTLRAQADFGVFVECPEALTRPGLVDRKHRQGRTREDAAAHYELVDHYAWQLLAEHRHGADAVLRVGPGRRLDCVLASA
jgi:pantothenate kinase